MLIAQLGSSELILVQWTVPQHQFRVIVTNDENRTYFSGPTWIAFAQRYGLAHREKLILSLDEGDNNILFDRVDPDDYVSSISYEEERGPRDEIDGELLE
jgi:hypothetical protein